jgi:ankyrin repeat protein
MTCVNIEKMRKKLIMVFTLFSFTTWGQIVCKSSFVATGSEFNDKLFDAIMRGNEEQVKYYLDKGADPNSIYQMEGTPILCFAVSKPGILNLMLHYKVDVNNEGYGDESALKYAIIYCYHEGAKILIEHGAKKDFLNKGNNPPLFQVIGRSYKPSNCPVLMPVRFAVELGADVNYQIDTGETPLMIAAAVGDIEVAKYLISKGAKKSIKNRKGQMAVDIAKKMKFDDLAVLLR